MKKDLLLVFALGVAFSASADLNGDGFYRVENYKTERYVSVVDDKGSINYSGTTADLEAIDLIKNFDEVSGDAATVLYVKRESGKQYNISAQGTGIHKIIDYYATIEENGTANGQKLYVCYGKSNGVIRYLGDGNVSKYDNYGVMSCTPNGDYRKWYIKPVDNSSDDNYFGSAATAAATTGSYSGLYAGLYAAFPVSVYSDGVKFYTIDKVGDFLDFGGVTLKEIEGAVPENTPVIVKCVGETSSDNRLNPGGTAAAVNGNSSLKGVFFNCNKGAKHTNRLAYNRDTMRVLGVCADGSLGFVQTDIDYIPANSIYLTVPAGSHSEFKCLTDEEYEYYYAAGVDEVGAGAAAKSVYTITGIKVADSMSADEIRALPAGLYIIGGKKVAIR